MPLPIVRAPCYICHLTTEKPDPSCKSTERLTRCIGSEFLLKFYLEGITKDENNRDTLADWVEERGGRDTLIRCNASYSGERYFHQSCLNRDQAAPLSRDNVYFHHRGRDASSRYPVLRNISHKCCGDCLSAAQANAPSEHRLTLKYQGVGEKEKELLEKQRGDRRSSKDRGTMTNIQARLQANGTTSVVVLTSRVGNKRASFTTVSDSLRQANSDYYRSVIATMNIQASELRAAPAPAAAVGPSQAGPSATVTADPGPSAAEAGPSNPSQPLQRGISRRQLSIAADEDSIINRWKGHRLAATATRAELKRFLEERQQVVHVNSKAGLLARVEAILSKEHPGGGLEPDAAMMSDIASAAGVESLPSSRQSRQSRQPRPKVPTKAEIQKGQATAMAEEGLDISLPTVTLKPIPDLRWALSTAQYLLQPGEGVEEGDREGEGATAFTGVALWAVTSTFRRDGLFQADKLSALDRAAKAPVGIVRGVEKGAAGQIKVHVWLLEARCEKLDEAASAAPDQGSAGEPGGAHEMEGDAEYAELCQPLTPPPGVRRGRGTKRRRAGRRRGSGRRGRSGRVSRPTARGADFWGSDDDSPNLFADDDDSEDEGGEAGDGQPPPPEQLPQPAEQHRQAEDAAQEAGHAAAGPRRSPLHGCLLAEGSSQPEPLPRVRLSMQGHAASPAKAAVLVVECAQIVPRLCCPKRVQDALKGEPGALLDEERAAFGVALAMVLADESNATRAARAATGGAAEAPGDPLPAEAEAQPMLMLPSGAALPPAVGQSSPGRQPSARDQPSAQASPGAPALGMSPPAFGVAAALDTVGLFSSQLNPSPDQPREHNFASSREDMFIQADDYVEVLADDGTVVGRAEVVGIGGDFHGTVMPQGMARVCAFAITDQAAARAQTAWLSDNAGVTAGVTPLAEIPRNRFVALPIRCMRFLGRSGPRALSPSDLE